MIQIYLIVDKKRYLNVTVIRCDNLIPLKLSSPVCVYFDVGQLLVIELVTGCVFVF